MSTDDVRCPVHVVDLASALLELAASAYFGVHHVVGADAISRYELGALIARSDGLDDAALPRDVCVGSVMPGPVDVRLGCAMTQARLGVPFSRHPRVPGYAAEGVGAAPTNSVWYARRTFLGPR